MEIQFSAGGIIFKKEDGKIFIIVAQHSGHNGWVFPKGLIGDHIENEGKETTALREVKEETGVNAKILQPLDPVEFNYIYKGVKIKKTVYYFLMEYLSGDISKHDWEMKNVEWLEKNNVEDRLTYPSDKDVWHQAEKLI